MELIFRGKRKPIRLGYEAPWQPISTEIDGFKGFVLSTGVAGVHAVQIIMGNNLESKWLGNPDQGPQTRHLVGDRIRALKASFDVWFFFRRCKLYHVRVGVQVD